MYVTATRTENTLLICEPAFDTFLQEANQWITPGLPPESAFTSLQLTPEEWETEARCALLEKKELLADSIMKTKLQWDEKRCIDFVTSVLATQKQAKVESALTPISLPQSQPGATSQQQEVQKATPQTQSPAPAETSRNLSRALSNGLITPSIAPKNINKKPQTAPLHISKKGKNEERLRKKK